MISLVLQQLLEGLKKKMARDVMMILIYIRLLFITGMSNNYHDDTLIIKLFE